jgi:magnesium chelatase subunit I
VKEVEGRVHRSRLGPGAVGRAFQKYFGAEDFQSALEWFDMGGYLELPDSAPADEILASFKKVPGLLDKTSAIVSNSSDSAIVVAAAEFILEGLAALKKISRSEEGGYHRTEEPRAEIGFERMAPTKRRLN